MKKFIAAFDGLNFSESTLNYAIFFAKHSGAHLVGVFLEDFLRHSYGVTDIMKYEGSDFDEHVRDLNEKDREERSESVARFEQACQNAGLNYAVHRDKNVAIQELLHESVYADLLIISAEETMTRYEEEPPTKFLKELLNDVQCPVIMAPTRYRPIDKVILLYDGEPSSVFAVRSFSYLFDSLKNFETEVITVKGREETFHVPDTRLIKEFIRRHYPKADYVVLKGNAEDEIIRYLHREKKDALVVIGAYRRSRFSRMFRPSMADYLIKETKVPLFIAHNKS